MALRVSKELVDDIDGSPAEATISFTYEGIDYRIDVNGAHAKELHDDFSKWVDHAQRVGGKPTARANGKSKLIRAWALENGHELSARGRIPADIQAAYELAR